MLPPHQKAPTPRTLGDRGAGADSVDRPPRVAARPGCVWQTSHPPARLSTRSKLAASSGQFTPQIESDVLPRVENTRTDLDRLPPTPEAVVANARAVQRLPAGPGGMFPTGSRPGTVERTPSWRASREGCPAVGSRSTQAIRERTRSGCDLTTGKHSSPPNERRCEVCAEPFPGRSEGGAGRPAADIRPTPGLGVPRVGHGGGRLCLSATRTVWRRVLERSAGAAAHLRFPGRDDARDRRAERTASGWQSEAVRNDIPRGPRVPQPPTVGLSVRHGSRADIVVSIARSGGLRRTPRVRNPWPSAAFPQRHRQPVQLDVLDAPGDPSPGGVRVPPLPDRQTTASALPASGARRRSCRAVPSRREQGSTPSGT